MSPTPPLAVPPPVAKRTVPGLFKSKAAAASADAPSSSGRATRSATRAGGSPVAAATTAAAAAAVPSRAKVGTFEARKAAHRRAQGVDSTAQQAAAVADVLAGNVDEEDEGEEEGAEAAAATAATTPSKMKIRLKMPTGRGTATEAREGEEVDGAGANPDRERSRSRPRQGETATGGADLVAAAAGRGSAEEPVGPSNRSRSRLEKGGAASRARVEEQTDAGPSTRHCSRPHKGAATAAAAADDSDVEEQPSSSHRVRSRSPVGGPKGGGRAGEEAEADRRREGRGQPRRRTMEEKKQKKLKKLAARDMRKPRDLGREVPAGATGPTKAEIAQALRKQKQAAAGHDVGTSGAGTSGAAGTSRAAAGAAGAVGTSRRAVVQRLGTTKLFIVQSPRPERHTDYVLQPLHHTGYTKTEPLVLFRMSAANLRKAYNRFTNDPAVRPNLIKQGDCLIFATDTPYPGSLTINCQKGDDGQLCSILGCQVWVPWVVAVHYAKTNLSEATLFDMMDGFIATQEHNRTVPKGDRKVSVALKVGGTMGLSEVTLRRK